MCGVAGFSGIKNIAKRALLGQALGQGIDARGGDACGYVSVDTHEGGAIRLHRRLGKFVQSGGRFLHGLKVGEVAMMHARFATCGTAEDVLNAHPYPISRNGKTVVYGAHNGMLTGTTATAKEHGRSHTVDSRELFELLADSKHEAINGLNGYGVVSFVLPGSGTVYLSRLSSSSDLVVCQVHGGGTVWASTKAILKAALKVAGMKVANYYTCDVVGQVYAVKGDSVMITDSTNLHVSKSTTMYRGYLSDAWDWGEEYMGADVDKPVGSGYASDSSYLDWRNSQEEWEKTLAERAKEERWIPDETHPMARFHARRHLPYYDKRALWDEYISDKAHPGQYQEWLKEKEADARSRQEMCDKQKSVRSSVARSVVDELTEDEFDRMTDAEIDAIIDAHVNEPKVLAS